MCVLTFSTNLRKTFLILKESSKMRSKMHISLHVKYPVLLTDFNKAWIFCTNFRNSNIKFHENSVFPCGQTDMKKLIVAFSNFANTPKSKVLKKINNLKLEETIFRNIQMFCSKTKKQMFSWKKKLLFLCFFWICSSILHKRTGTKPKRTHFLFSLPLHSWSSSPSDFWKVISRY